jgi:hypothetical protein
MSIWSFILLIGVFVTVWVVLIHVLMREFPDDSDSQADDAIDI